jgi:hypothetical protein
MAVSLVFLSLVAVYIRERRPLPSCKRLGVLIGAIGAIARGTSRHDTVKADDPHFYYRNATASGILQ